MNTDQMILTVIISTASTWLLILVAFGVALKRDYYFHEYQTEVFEFFGWLCLVLSPIAAWLGFPAIANIYLGVALAIISVFYWIYHDFAMAKTESTAPEEKKASLEELAINH